MAESNPVPPGGASNPAEAATRRGNLRHLGVCGEDEWARAERGRSQFALMRVHAIGEIAPHAVEEAIARTIRAADVVAAADGDRIWEVLIVNATPAVADRVLARFATQTADYTGR